MTTAALTPSKEYIENGVTLVYAVPFRFRSPQHISASRVSASGVVTDLAYGTDYSVTGGTTDAGGSLTVVAAGVAGTILRIKRVTPRAQTMDYTAADTFPAESHETALDTAMLIDQEQDQKIDDTQARALLVPDGETAPAVPAKTLRAGKYLLWSADGEELLSSSGTGTDAGVRTDLADPNVGASIVAMKQTGAGAATREVDDEIRAIGVDPDQYTGGGDTIKLQAAIAEAAASGRSLRVRRSMALANTRNDIPAAGMILEGEGAAKLTMPAAGTAIAVYGLNITGKISISNIVIDGTNGGQLNAGLVQINGTGGHVADFLNVVVQNGGTINAANPSGVDGYAFAGHNLGGAGENKSRFRIIGGRVKATTKAGLNATSGAEDFFVTDLLIEEQQGNGTTPNYQFNGARRGVIKGCVAKNAEGTNYFVGTNVDGALPGGYYESKDLWFDGCVGIGAGGIGAASVEGHGFMMSNSGGSIATWSGIHRLDCSTLSARWNAGLIASIRGVRVLNEYSQETTGGLLVQNAKDVSGQYHAVDVNKRSLSNPAVLDLRGSQRVSLKLHYDQVTDTVPPYMVLAQTSDSSEIDIEASWNGALVSSPLVEEQAGRFKGRFRFSHRYDLAIGATQNVQVMFLANGKSALLFVRARAFTPSGDLCIQEKAFRIKGGAPCVATVVSPVDSKNAGFANGLGVDTSINNQFAIVFAGHSTETCKLDIDFDMVIG